MGAASGAVAKARARPGMVAYKAAKVEGDYRTCDRCNLVFIGRCIISVVTVVIGLNMLLSSQNTTQFCIIRCLLLRKVHGGSTETFKNTERRQFIFFFTLFVRLSLQLSV